MGEQIPELMNGQFNEFIQKGLVLMDFYAEWCMPCVMMGPVVDGLSETFEGKIRFGKVNVEDAPALAQKFGIRSIPHFILFKDGEPLETFTGALDEQEFEELLAKHL